MLRPALAVPVLLMLLVSACGSSATPSRAHLTSAGTTSAAVPSTAAPTATAPTATAPTPSAPTGTAAKHHEKHPDPRWQFFTSDHHWYTSRWFHGTHRIMIGFGCNASPWYDHDPACPGKEGFHHGIDVAMPCGTKLYAGHAGTVLSRSAPGTPGPAYGVNPVRIRITGRNGAHDVLIGHTRTVYVHPGQHVTKGQKIALASDSGAPDGCHLHFEVRPVGGGYTTAINPARWLKLVRA